MAFDLEGKAGSFRMSNSGWPEVLAIAEAYGWKPAGTRPPRGSKPGGWDGGYRTNDGQVVTKVDASALAAALDDALKDDLQRAPGKAPPQSVTDSERQQAFEKLAGIAAGMTFEVVKPRKKSAPDPKPKKKPPEKGKPAGSLEELVAAQGLAMNDLPGLLSALRSPPVGSQPPDAWFETNDGQQLIRDLIAFCRAGEFRIL